MTHLLLAVIYLAFISLGLPDGLLGAAWPVMYGQFAVPVSYAGAVTMIISAGTVVSSLMSDRLTRRLGTGRVTAVSVALTALALFSFSWSRSFWLLCLWAVPYGLGAGSVDASLNNYVALHYASRHMSWLHCMWGVGASVGPYVMGWTLTAGRGWPAGYRTVGYVQLVITVLLFLSLPLWRRRSAQVHVDAPSGPPLSLRRVVRIPGAKAVLITFFCYSALETTSMVWSGSYLYLVRGMDAETAAFFASMFYLGMTVGRAISGFLTIRLTDPQMIRLGTGIITAGLVTLFLPLGTAAALVGLALVGLGCAPIYPCIIHSTPVHFGADNSQAVIGVQMACAYTATTLIPPLFGLVADHISPALFPVFLLIFLIPMAIAHYLLLRATRAPG